MCLNKLLLLAHICTADSVYELENTWQYFVCISVSKYMLKSVEEYHTVYSADQILQQARCRPTLLLNQILFVFIITWHAADKAQMSIFCLSEQVIKAHAWDKNVS